MLAPMTDTIVWISGASTGLGAALAATVPYEDAHVIDISRSGGGPADDHLPADLSDPSAWAAVEAHFRAQLGRFAGRRAVFVHNAGTLHPMGFAGEVDSDAYRANVLLNAAAPQVLGHAFLRAVAELDCELHLVMLTSGAARSPYAGWSSYCGGKAAVDQWVRCAGLEQQRRSPGCRVIAVAPGVLDTGMQRRIRDMDEADFPAVGKFRDLHERGALIPPEDAARRIWSLLGREVDNGAVVDLRDLHR
jgi:benzil reductase ((S)-benzoin forming)